MASETRPHEVHLTRTAIRALKRLPAPDRRRIAGAIDSLAGSPRPRGCERIAGGKGLLRVRQGAYRIVYSVDDRRRLVLVVTIGHRRDVYRGLP